MLTSQVLQKYNISGIHPAATMLPPMIDDEFNSLVDAIHERGVQQPVTINSEGQLLDGRNRVLAADKLGLTTIPTETVDPSDPVMWVMDRNVHRRHLTTAQRLLIALELPCLKQGRPSAAEVGKGLARGLYSQKAISKVCGIGEATLQRGIYIQEHAPKLLERIKILDKLTELANDEFYDAEKNIKRI